MKFDTRVIDGGDPTLATSVNGRGQYTRVEVWANKARFKIMLDRYFNLVSIHRFVRRGDRPWDYWYWRQEFNRHYKRKSTLIPLHVDIVCCAVAKAMEKRNMGNSDLIDLEDWVLHHETEKAVLVSEEHDSEKFWLPLSQVEVEQTGRKTKFSKLPIVDITLPQWLAEEKGLV
jgi:hypothetical protein